MKKLPIHSILLRAILILVVLPKPGISQATFAAGSYSQNFGTSAIASWTDNSTFPGWYIANPANFQGTINITAAAPSNNGGVYMYTCNAGTDMHLGTRPSNTSSGGPCDATPTTCGHGIGLRLTNNFGNAIVSIKVEYDWYQMSLAQNGSAVNSMLFYYKTGAGPLTSVSNTVTTGTHVPTLDFTCPQSSAVASSNQINGYPCSQTGHVSGCIVVAVPANSEIFFSWWDPNNASNDPHLAIDNVSIMAYSDNVCSVILPIDLVSFTATPIGNNAVNLNWKTSSETNNNFFTIERSNNGEPFQPIAYVTGNGTTSQEHYYTTIDNEPGLGINYYKLRQTDYNGHFVESSILAVNMNQSEDFESLFYLSNFDLNYKVNSEEEFDILITDISGRIIYNQQNNSSQSGSINVSEWSHGIYLIRCNNKWKCIIQKVVI